VLIDGGYGINIIIENLIVQLDLSKLNPTPYNLCMANQTIAIWSYEGPENICSWYSLYNYIIIINNNVLNSSYSMLLGCPWLRDA